MLEMMVHNAHYLFKNCSKSKMPITDFKEHAVKWLLGEITLPNYLQQTANFHYLHPIPASGKKRTQQENVLFAIKKEKGENQDTYVHIAMISLHCVFIPALSSTILIWVLPQMDQSHIKN